MGLRSGLVYTPITHKRGTQKGVHPVPLRLMGANLGSYKPIWLPVGVISEPADQTMTMGHSRAEATRPV